MKITTCISNLGDREIVNFDCRIAAYSALYDRIIELCHDTGAWPKWYVQVGPDMLKSALPALAAKGVYIGVATVSEEAADIGGIEGVWKAFGEQPELIIDICQILNISAHDLRRIE